MFGSLACTQPKTVPQGLAHPRRREARLPAGPRSTKPKVPSVFTHRTNRLNDDQIPYIRTPNTVPQRCAHPRRRESHLPAARTFMGRELLHRQVKLPHRQDNSLTYCRGVSSQRLGGRQHHGAGETPRPPQTPALEHPLVSEARAEGRNSSSRIRIVVYCYYGGKILPPQFLQWKKFFRTGKICFRPEAPNGSKLLSWRSPSGHHLSRLPRKV